jgi:hypothetical protein
MTPRRLLRALARLLPLLILSLALPRTALSQLVAPGPAELAPEARARLARAAEDSLLAPWQRDLMLRLARSGTTAGLDSSAADLRVAQPSPALEVGDGAWSRPQGLSRGGHSAIYDPVRDRMVVFGGSSSDSPDYLNDVWALSLAGTPAWTQLTPSGTPPTGRVYHSAIYDPVRDRMVVFGGYYYDYHDGVSHYLNDVWVLSLAGTPAWTQLTPSGTPPTGRDNHSAIYDPVRDRMVVFGGAYYDGSSYYLNDAWVLSLTGAPVWMELAPTGSLPSARSGHSAIYDPVRDRMVVFGGAYYDGLGYYLNDAWALSLAGAPVWMELAPTGGPPSARSGHSAIYDPVRDRMVVFGGTYYDGSSHDLNDVWALSLAATPAWMQPTPSGTPPARRGGHSAIYDPVRDRMVVFGGWSGPSTLNEFWTLALAGEPVWMQLTPSGTPPSARSEHSAIHDQVRDRMVVFGGYSTSPLNDVWVLSLADGPAWAQLTPSGTPPSARSGHSAIYDPVRDCMVVFGGHSSSLVDNNDVWALSLAGTSTWTQLAPSGMSPSARNSHCAIYDPVRDRMVVFGGYGLGPPFGYLNDVWALSLAGTPAWTELAPAGTAPSARRNPSAIYDPVRDRMVVFGGSSSSSVRINDIWDLSLAVGPIWTQLTPSGTLPAVRYLHSAIYDPARDRMVVFGGYSGSISMLNDVWSLSLEGATAWTQQTPSGTPPGGRDGHSAIYDPVRDRMVVFGGYWGRSVNDVWALGWSFNTAVGGPEVQPFISCLRPPAPNPARGTTVVSFALAQAGRVQLGVYDVGGRLVRKLVDGERRAGTETVVWNGTAESGAKLQAGVYFVRLAAPGFRETRRVILLK